MTHSYHGRRAGIRGPMSEPFEGEKAFEIEVDLGPHVETRESVTARLLDVETRLASVLGLTGDDLHGQIVSLSERGEMEETTLAHEWYSAMAADQDWREDP